MTNVVWSSRIGPEFDDFLYASICDERNGQPLSVISALARSDLDPWREATALAELSPNAAMQRLTSLIAELPDDLSAHFAPMIIAARLTALLPRRTGANIVSSKIRMRADEISILRARTCMYAIVVIVMLGTQWMVGAPKSQGQVERSTSISSTASYLNTDR